MKYQARVTTAKGIVLATVEADEKDDAKVKFITEDVELEDGSKVKAIDVDLRSVKKCKVRKSN